VPALPRTAAVAALLALAAGPAAAETKQLAPAPDELVRLGVEAGGAWFGPSPIEAPGGSGTLRLRVQPADRIVVAGAVTRLRQAWPGGWLDTTILPLTVDLRLDRAPLAPFVGVGYAAIVLPGGGALADRLGTGGVLEVGAELHLAPGWAATAQATYVGLAGQDFFPFFSTLSAGVARGF
jgi:hypothetical protein